MLLCLLAVLPPAVLSYAAEIPPSPYWKTEIVFPDDPFRAAPTYDGQPGWVKFTILTEPYDPNICYFQDSNEYVFHYDFARDLLPPFLGMTPAQFDQATLYQTGQQAILGAVIMPPNTGWPTPFPYPEYGIQFVRRDPYTKEQIAQMFDIVKLGIVADPNVQAFYFPAYEQIGTAEANRAWFEAQGIHIASPARWTPGNIVYSSGWALGEMKYFEGQNIAHAYQTGQLEPNDILLTDGVPAEIPHVAGIISLSPSTPNSHVAILAQTFSVPFVHLALEDDVDRAWQLVGRRVILRAFELWQDTDIKLIDIEDILDDDTIDEILQLKEPPALDISPTAHYGSYSASTDGLSPSDIKYFGGKAANFGILRTSIPDNSPVAVAFSFDLWNEFLNQMLITGRTLREEIDARLSPYTYPPSNMDLLSAELLFIRGLFTADYLTAFTQAQTNAVIAVIEDPQYGFDPLKKIRFRSSTNVEDSNNFTGAGLYDSFSGCLADDLDGNTSGPCICDPNHSNERGVFRAIRKVFAGFYNDNAFLERLRHGIDETTVGMALLVHHSFPDQIELANGVATLQKRGGTSRDITLVTQTGAVSVTNPTDGSIPEEVSVYYSTYGVNPTLHQPSNLLPLGATVLQWQDEYKELCELLVQAADQFAAATGKTQYTLDFEYKKVAPGGGAMPAGGLVVKQIRQIPRPDNRRTITPFLVAEQVEYCTFQGEYGDVFANHRLKSRWRLETNSTWLWPKDLAQSLFTHAELEYVDNDRVRRVSGAPANWPFASHKYEEGSSNYQANTVDQWLMHHLANRRTCELYTNGITFLVSPAENPMLTFSDLGWVTLNVEYDRPVEAIDYQGNPIKRRTESIRLAPCPQPRPGDLLQQRDARLGRGTSINISFYWPPEPTGVVAGYTAPLVRWVETVITGYTTEPIVLHGWHSQTYHPGHHNFSEEFILEPQLEPGLSEQLLDELRTQDIRMIYLVFDQTYDEKLKKRIYILSKSAIYGYHDEPFLGADLDADGDVDFRDAALFAPHWRRALCNTCDGTDLDGDGCVLAADLRELAHSWLATLD